MIGLHFLTIIQIQLLVCVAPDTLTRVIQENDVCSHVSLCYLATFMLLSYVHVTY